MSTSSPTPTTPAPLIPRDKLLTVISCETRWVILKALCDEPLGAMDIAQLMGSSSSAATKQMHVLMDVGIVVQGRGRLYHLAPAYRPPPGQYVLDFGHCLLRLDAAPPAA